VRHAKAEAGGATDAERALAPRGLRDAAAIGQWLGGLSFSPDRVVVSPARRARQTWALAAAELEASPSPLIDDRLYENTIEDLLAVVADCPVEIETLVLVGHNPSMHGLAVTLDDGAGDPEVRRLLAAEFPTSAVAVFEIAGDWSGVGAGTGRLTAAGVPRG
jgi:phosphohistidine phosphatase